VIGQEAGHRWLAFLEFSDVNRQPSDALLGRDLAHWSFFFNSDASVMEGNRIQDLGGATATALGPAPAGLAGAGGVAWNSANELAVAGSPETGVTVYSTRGGEPRTLVSLDKKKESDFHEISALPGARGWLVAIHRSQGSDTIAAVVNGVRKDVLTIAGETLRTPVYLKSGYLLFQRARNNIGLVAVPFSLERLETTGEPFMVVPGAWQPSVTTDGTELAFVRKLDQQA